MSDDIDNLKPDELRDLVRRLRKDLAHEKRLREITDTSIESVRERLDAAGETREQWIEVFRMERNTDGDWVFDQEQSELWDEHDALLDKYGELLRDWNRFVPKYNAVVANSLHRGRGRPLAASEAQARAVMRMRMAGGSLRGIAAATNLGLKTVRSILATGKATQQRRALVRRELNKEAAARYRARKRARDHLQKRINEDDAEYQRMAKIMKGLGG